MIGSSVKGRRQAERLAASLAELERRVDRQGRALLALTQQMQGLQRHLRALLSAHAEDTAFIVEQLNLLSGAVARTHARLNALETDRRELEAGGAPDEAGSA